MMTNQYYWKGIIQSGETISGVIEAISINLAKAELRKQGIITRKIRLKRHSLLTNYTRSIKPADINLFTRQLATLHHAGVPLENALQILKKGTSNPFMNKLIQSIQTDVKTGLMLTQALSKYPAYFNSLFCNMIHAGEQSGSLDMVLLKMADYKENMTDIRKKINKAMAYPFAVIVIAMLVTAGLLTCVIPQFDALFKSFDAELPLLTRYIIHLSFFFKSWWSVMMFMFTVLVYGGFYAYKHRPAVSKITHQFLLRIPIMGTIIQKSAISRFTRTLSITVAAGLPLTEALTSVTGVTGNLLYAQATFKIKADISQGQSLTDAINNTQLFPDMVIQLISIGEESGTLEHMLRKIAEIYEKDVDTAIHTFSDLLEPVIMTILGLLIGGLVVAMYLPILKLGSIV